MPRVRSQRFSFSFPVSMTKTTSGNVREASAMFVARTTLRTPGGGILNACSSSQFHMFVGCSTRAYLSRYTDWGKLRGRQNTLGIGWMSLAAYARPSTESGH